MMPEKFSTMRESVASNEVVDSCEENQNSFSLKQLNSIARQHKNQRILHDEVERNAHHNADLDLEKELLGLGVSIDENKLEKGMKIDLEVENNLSTQQKIKNYTESLKGKKPHQEILRLLIAIFENENGVETLIGNFKNYLKLYQFAESKPPQERKAIQRIISNADFSNESAFSNSLAQISKSVQISKETKFEIIKKFGGAHIDSVGGLDYQLKQVKQHTKAIEQEIDNKSREKESLDSEIEDLQAELDSLPLDSPKLQELEAKIEQKKELLENTENEINRLEKGKPKETSFVLREGFSAKLNPDGSRSIKIDENFTVKIPSHRLPFTTTKNLRAINLVFPFKILKDLQIADVIFSPNLENNAVPTKSQRDMGHLVLGSLGIDDTKILSKENIKKLKKDLSFFNLKNGKSGFENLVELRIYDITSQSLDKTKLKNTLKFIKDNRVM